MIDLLAVVVILTALVGSAVPVVTARLDDATTLAATRWLVSRMQRARVDSVSRSTSVGLRFGAAADGYGLEVHADGNGNGLRSDEIRSGVDPSVGPLEHLDEHFPGVSIGALPGLPAVDGGSDPPGDDPVRFGVSRTVSFAPEGSATPGTIYILGRRGAQYAVRVAGETGRIRAWRFDGRLRAWHSL
jgi:hypothetical protein